MPVGAEPIGAYPPGRYFPETNYFPPPPTGEHYPAYNPADYPPSGAIPPQHQEPYGYTSPVQEPTPYGNDPRYRRPDDNVSAPSAPEHSDSGGSRQLP